METVENTTEKQFVTTEAPFEHTGLARIDTQKAAGSEIVETGAGEEVEQAEEERGSAKGVVNMVAGALWCIGGIAVTAISYSAVSETGGHYIIAWGAVLFGGYQFFKGLVQAIS